MGQEHGGPGGRELLRGCRDASEGPGSQPERPPPAKVGASEATLACDERGCNNERWVMTPLQREPGSLQGHACMGTHGPGGGGLTQWVRGPWGQQTTGRHRRSSYVSRPHACPLGDLLTAKAQPECFPQTGAWPSPWYHVVKVGVTTDAARRTHFPLGKPPTHKLCLRTREHPQTQPCSQKRQDQETQGRARKVPDQETETGQCRHEGQ